MNKKNVPPHAHYADSWDEDLARDLRNPEFRKGFEAEKLKLEVALTLIALRKKNKMTQATLAKKLGTSQSAIARIEAGKLNITVDTLSNIAWMFGKNVKISLV